ncbi:MAG: hypothetical protein P4L11_03270 [Geothrix sp.]|nr:hypothetical protein [Geothrix sp.]
MHKAFLLPLLALPLAAQNLELGLHVSQQSYSSQSIPNLVEPQDKMVLAARLGYAIVDLGPALFQVTAVYQPRVDTDMKVDGVTSRTTLGHEYWGMGAMFNFKAAIAVGAGLDYRFEKISAHDAGTVSTTFGRPWARLNAGYAFPTPVMKPFLGLEVAAPLTKNSYDRAAAFEDQLKSWAPKLQVGLYGGIRF